MGKLKLALMNEILGRSAWAPTIFGCQAPDTGNAEILAHYGSEAQKETYLQPLLDGEIVSCYSMTEPQGGADPKVFSTRAVRDGDEWVIDGWKFFSSHARWASFLIVMVVTDPEVEMYRGASMFIVPAETPGLQYRPQRGTRRRANQRRCPWLGPLRWRASSGRELVGRGRSGVRHRPDSPRRRPHPSRHAHRRPGPAAASTCSASEP